MVAVAMVLVWAGYGTGLFGWTLFEDYDVTLGQMMSPAHPYSGAWPPPKIPAGQTWPGKNTSSSANSSSTGSSPSTASKLQAGESVFSKVANLGRFLP